MRPLLVLLSLALLVGSGCPAAPGSSAGSGAPGTVANDPLDFLAGLPSVTLVSLNPVAVGIQEAELREAQLGEDQPSAAEGPAEVEAPAASPAAGSSQQVLHGYQVLGSTELTDADQRRALEALRRSRDESTGISAKCFEPRHALRGEQDGRQVDVVICFQCMSMVVHEGEESSWVPITHAAESTLSRLLDAAGVQRDKP